MKTAVRDIWSGQVEPLVPRTWVDAAALAYLVALIGGIYACYKVYG